MHKFFQSPIVKKAVVILVIAALAAAGEFCYVALSKPSLDYSRASYAAAAFSGWEVEETANGEYYMLANNSYFLLQNLGGIPVQTIDIRLSRNNADNTETVLYYKGVQSGVYGEFPVAMQKTAEGVYSATLNAASVDSIRIHPTEQVRTTIRFDGITVNPSITQNTFSVSRVLLWGFLLSCLYILFQFCLFFLAVLRKRKHKSPMRLQPADLSGWTAVYCIGGAVLLLVAFQATRMFTGASGAEHVLLPMVFVIFSVFYLLVWLLVKRIAKTELKVLVVVAALGTLFAFANAPLQTPDEFTHFMRAYTVSRGQFVFDYHYAYPDDVQRLASTFSAELNDQIQNQNASGVPQKIAEYMATADLPYSGRTYNTSIQIIVPYLPAAIGIAIARLFGANALIALYAARLCNVAVLALCAWLAVKWAARYRGALIAMILLPMTLYMGASTSYDSMFLACIILFFGLLFKEEVFTRDILLLCGVFGIILAIKPLYLPLVLLLFLIPKENLRTKLPRWSGAALVAAAGLVIYAAGYFYAVLFARDIPPVGNPSGADVGAQIQFILSNPLRYLMVFAVDAYSKVLYLTQYGQFGWLDVDAAWTGFLTPLVLVIVGALYADLSRAYKKSDKWIHLLTTVLVYGAVVTGFYATWSTLGSTSILGVQARYFIPVLPCCVALLSQCMSPVVRFRSAVNYREEMRDEACVYLCSAVALIGVAELALHYFLT